jgi:hypothetical protein
MNVYSISKSCNLNKIYLNKIYLNKIYLDGDEKGIWEHERILKISRFYNLNGDEENNEHAGA